MTARFDAAVSALSIMQGHGVRSAAAGLNAARAAGDPGRIAGATRLLRAEIAGAALSPADRATVFAECGITPPPSPRRVAAAQPVTPVVPVATRPPVVTEPPRRPDDGSDVLALIGKVGLSGFNLDAAAKTWTFTREVAADGSDVLELIQCVGLSGFQARAA